MRKSFEATRLIAPNATIVLDVKFDCKFPEIRGSPVRLEFLKIEMYIKFIHKRMIFMSTNLAIRIEKFDGKLERTDWVSSNQSQSSHTYELSR
jgi:hypothetical protein